MDGGKYTCMAQHPSVKSLSRKRTISITLLTGELCDLCLFHPEQFLIVCSLFPLSEKKKAEFFFVTGGEFISQKTIVLIHWFSYQPLKCHDKGQLMRMFQHHGAVKKKVFCFMSSIYGEAEESKAFISRQKKRDMIPPLAEVKMFLKRIPHVVRMRNKTVSKMSNV